MTVDPVASPIGIAEQPELEVDCIVLLRARHAARPFSRITERKVSKTALVTDGGFP